MQQRCGSIAVVGVPNAGKSSLLNRWVGQKVSIVSPKPQTTRIPIVGVAIHQASQMVFLDAPGLFESGRKEDRAMLRGAWKTLEHSDCVCVVVDVSQKTERQNRVIDKIFERCQAPKVLVLNKIDRVSKEQLLERTLFYAQSRSFSKVFMVSARFGDGVKDVLEWVAQAMPHKPWVYPEDQVSTLPERFLAEEMTREQVFLQMNQEVPYAIQIRTEKWEVTRRQELKIHQVLYVNKASQKAMLLGRGGQKIQAIGSAARAQMAHLLQRPVHLFLFVKLTTSALTDLTLKEAENLGSEFY